MSLRWLCISFCLLYMWELLAPNYPNFSAPPFKYPQDDTMFETVNWGLKATSTATRHRHNKYEALRYTGPPHFLARLSWKHLTCSSLGNSNNCVNLWISLSGFTVYWLRYPCYSIVRPSLDLKARGPSKQQARRIWPSSQNLQPAHPNFCWINHCSMKHSRRLR